MTTKPLFPLIRHVSGKLSPLIILLPVSANLVTTASLLSGLAACWYLINGTYSSTLIGALLLFVCYVLDNSDGEVARAKKQSSSFGDKYDTFADWIVHTGLFAALGFGVARQTGADYWLWLGLFGSAGGTINYGLKLYLDYRDQQRLAGETRIVTDATSPAAEQAPAVPQGVVGWGAYILRELSRADFCFIVMALALFDVTWILLPTAAVGAHAYWIAIFVEGARKHRV